MVEFNEHKFKELILYIATQCKEDVFYGAVKLNKVLFFSDFLAHERLGQPITGAEYMAIEHGPAPRRLLPIREEMLEEGDIVVEQRAHQTRILAAREPDLKQFSPEELAIVDYVVLSLRNIAAEEVSDLTHQLPGWRAARARSLETGENAAISYTSGPVSGVLSAAAQAGDPLSWELYRRGEEDLQRGRFFRLDEVKRRLGDL
jgi:uncharacterized phage-associated protein